MNKNDLPLKDISIRELFCQGERNVYEIPVYQRNYAWEKDEICALIRDVRDSMSKVEKPTYYIGTLVTYDKGDRVYEVIDGQQRLTTIYLILKALEVEKISNKLTYRARRKSDDTLASIPKFDTDNLDVGIKNGYGFAVEEIDENEKKEFKDYFLDNVRIIHYVVPRDIDLNHYFEIMNSRGEQLEKHEIIKARLMKPLSDEDSNIFSKIWDACSEMNVYVQQMTDSKVRANVFGKKLYDFLPEDYCDLKKLMTSDASENANDNHLSIADIIKTREISQVENDAATNHKDTFQPIIDFPNFLLVVLKLVRLEEAGFDASKYNLDDKELINEFDGVRLDSEWVKKFAFKLFKAKFLLDNYVVHHSKEPDTEKSNPWKLQVLTIDKNNNDDVLRNLIEGSNQISKQSLLVHLQSMFEVAFTARQRKNYLVYCLMYLMKTDLHNFDADSYINYLEDLADRFFHGIYMSEDKLNDVNKPKPGSFDDVILKNGDLNAESVLRQSSDRFVEQYGDGSLRTRGIPLFIFNYMDYRIWKFYYDNIRGEDLSEKDVRRIEFFEKLGCSDFGLKIFRNFYFSRTRTSLEHYYPQNQATGEDERPDLNNINCFGNFAMIAGEANSSGSDWSPETKVQRYRDYSKKINPVSVASLKFWIMMQRCEDVKVWNYDEIKRHQKKMLDLLFDS